MMRVWQRNSRGHRITQGCLGAVPSIYIYIFDEQSAIKSRREHCPPFPEIQPAANHNCSLKLAAEKQVCVRTGSKLDSKFKRRFLLFGIKLHVQVGTCYHLKSNPDHQVCVTRPLSRFGWHQVFESHSTAPSRRIPNSGFLLYFTTFPGITG